MHNGRCAIAVMAKAPRAGKVKTRLQPPLSPDAAMELSRSFLRDVTQNIRLAARDAPIDGWVAFTPAGTEALFGGMLAGGTRLILADGEIETPNEVQGFGRSLLHAARALFKEGYAAVCLLNADSPNLPTACLVGAAQALAEPGDRIVLGPAEDGGYYLIGMKTPDPMLFSDIAWSTETVAEQTRERAAARGLEVVELDPWYDVDDTASLERLVRDLFDPDALDPPAYAAPATADCVRRLDLGEILGNAA